MIAHVQISLQVLNVIADTITFAARLSAASVPDHWTPGYLLVYHPTARRYHYLQPEH